MTQIENDRASPGRADLISGKRVLITGANGGIGRELVAAFAAARAKSIIALVHDNPAPIAHAATVASVDITDTAAVAQAVARFGDDVDILVNNAGVNGNARFLGTDVSVARREMEVNYFGTLAMIHAFLPAMRRRGSGTIVNIMSMAAHMAYPTMGSYSASKAALFAMNQALRAEVARYGIGVIAVFPPVVDTRMSAHLNIPKSPPRQVADELIAGINAGHEDIFIGPAAELYEEFRKDPKAMERKLALRIAGS